MDGPPLHYQPNVLHRRSLLGAFGSQPLLTDLTTMIQTSPRRFEFKVVLAFLAAAAFGAGCSSNVFGWQSKGAVAPSSTQSSTTQASTQQASAIDQAITRSTEFLVSQQADDGAWHSKHYGAMKQGAANTALVLYALSHLPADQLQEQAEVIKSATDFLLPSIKKLGCVANPDGSLDYPVYSTALILSASKRIDLGLTPAQIQSMIKYLLDSQCVKSRGFTQQNPHHGGWDILGPGPTQGKSTGANVSVTFYVVEALTLFQSEQTAEQGTAGKLSANRLSKETEKGIESALAAANQWCRRIQSTDGGFYFTSKRKSGLNKAGWTDKEQTTPNPYGSATCDGAGILLQLGATTSEDSYKKSIKWLVDHPGVDTVPGFKTNVDSIGWPSSLRFYYAASLSRLLSEFEKEQTAKTRAAIEKQLTDTQLKSGAWKNESSHMRENDELIATPFGLIALLNCKSISMADAEPDH